MRRKFIIAGSSTLAAGIVATALVLMPGSASAGVASGASTAATTSTSSAAPSGTTAGAGKSRTVECRAAGKLDKRWDRAEKRLNGAATDKGSIAWVKQQAADATKAGQADKAAALTKRADRMSHRLQVGTKLTGDISAAVTADC